MFSFRKRVIPLGLFQAVLDYIELNYRESITIEHLAAALGYNKSYLCTLFKAESGYSIMTHLNYVRISHAEDLVRNTDLTIAEVSSMVGYRSPSHFSRVFRQIVGKTPTQVRASEPEINRLDFMD